MLFLLHICFSAKQFIEVASSGRISSLETNVLITRLLVASSRLGAPKTVRFAAMTVRFFLPEPSGSVAYLRILLIS